MNEVSINVMRVQCSNLSEFGSFFFFFCPKYDNAQQKLSNTKKIKSYSNKHHSAITGDTKTSLFYFRSNQRA